MRIPTTAAILLSSALWAAGPARAGDAPVNVALASHGAVVVADSVYKNGEDKEFLAAHAIDGQWIGPGDYPGKNRWSSGQLPHPHWAWIRFRQPARIARVVLHRAHDVDYPVDFVGECSPDGGATFRTLFEVKNSKMDAATFTVERSFDPVVTDNFRLRIDRSSMQEQPNWAQLSEVEVFGQFVDAPRKTASPAPVCPLPPAVLKPMESPGLEIKPGKEEIEFRSPWLRLVLARNRPRITAMSWDSLGKGNVAVNLLGPEETGGGQLMAGTPVFASPASARPAPAECEGNVVRYRMEFAGGARGRWEIRVEERSLRMAVSYAAAAGTALSMPPAVRLGFDLGVSSVAPLANPPLGPPGPLPLPCLLHHGRNGSLLVECDEGSAASLVGSGSGREWAAFLMGETRMRPDRLYFLPEGTARWDIRFTVAAPAMPLPEVFAAEPRLWAMSRHWINGFQYRPDVGLLSNNIVSTPCANCIHLQGAVAAFTPPLPGGVEAIQSVRASEERWLDGTPGYGNGEPFMDGVPSLLIAAWDVIRVTGDLELLNRWLPILEKRVAQWKSRDVDGNGLYEASFSGNRGDWRGSVNAWDCINFGHEDAYSLAMGYRGLRCLADLERLAGRAEQAKTYDRDADRIRAAFVPTFLNPKTGILAGWKSRDGELHDYWFTFINGQAIVYGLVDDALANQIMDRIQAKFKEVGYTRFDLGLPWQLVPVPKNDYVRGAAVRIGGSIKEDGSDGFQNFVNGGAHAQSYCYIQALYQLGRREEADRLLWPMMATHAAGGFQNGIGGGGELTRWDGKPSGYEGFLSHCYRGQLATVTGYYGVVFTPEGFKLAPWSPLKGKRVKLGLTYMGKVVEYIE